MRPFETGSAIAVLSFMCLGFAARADAPPVPNDPRALYDAACALARDHRAEPALDTLKQSIALGFHDEAHLAKDPDLVSLHANPRWPGVLEQVRAQAAADARLWNSPTFRTPFRETLSEDERIAGLSRLWLEGKINFANFDLVPALDWDASYQEYLPKVRRARSTWEYYRLLTELGAKLRDGHTGVSPPKELERLWYSGPALRTRLVEDTVLIVGVDDERLVQDGVVAGLELVEIDGLPARAYGEQRVARFQSASTKPDLDNRTFGRALLAGPPGTPVTLLLRDEKGRTHKKLVKRLPPDERWKQAPNPPPAELKMLPGNLAYVALNTFASNATAERFEALFAELSRADALILDVRENGGGSSNVGYRILAALTDKPFKTSSWRTREYRPSYRAWGLGEGRFEETAQQWKPSGARLFRKPVALLTSVRTFSAAEDFAVAFDAMDRGPIIGEATGGSTGQPLEFDLPGGGKARICTKRDTYPDGREFIGVGVQPDLVVHPTVADVRAGRDPVLDAAVARLRGGPPR